MAIQERMEVAEYDVVIVGGGPVGLLMAYQLKRFGVSVCVLEQHDKNTQDAYGRAIALFPRTTEQLDQLDLIDPMLQLGFACRSSVTYKDGERVIPGRVWTFMEKIKDTNYDFTLVLRQKHTEAILGEKIASVGASYHQSVECVDFQVDTSAPLDTPGVTSTFTNRKTQRTFKLKSKYLIGADGGRSYVRRKADIPFDGDTSEDRWIRIDGIVETDLPVSRAYGAIESRTHGNVLWAPLDNGATRIGYAFSPEIAAKYPDGVTQEVALKEAIECMKPFKVVFKEVHWWTLYTIGQRIARDFSTPDRRIFLCGDAAHTHSSGAAQGLNTGIHDAVNLGWKLALQIRGIAKDEVLDTYSAERMTAVQQLINHDKDIAMLMSHKWPAWYKGDPSADPYLALGELFEKAAPFNTGLGISYPENLLNQAGSSALAVAPGSRPPDVELTMPGINRPVRLQRVSANFAKFFVVVFTGDINATRSSIQELERYLSEKAKDLRKHSAIGWITVSPVTGCSPFEALGTHPVGDTYYDPTSVAHEKFGIDMEKGNAVILRPDGLVGAGGAISGPWIGEYFSKVFKV
ncbi:FAD binding domain-containing protein [Coniochaeta sp. 2T2.1]|nr:FAD binding domain-containing protein [Coniochaeta sp. 2T2.1]